MNSNGSDIAVQLDELKSNIAQHTSQEQFLDQAIATMQQSLRQLAEDSANAGARVRHARGHPRDRVLRAGHRRRRQGALGHDARGARPRRGDGVPAAAVPGLPQVDERRRRGVPRLAARGRRRRRRRGARRTARRGRAAPAARAASSASGQAEGGMAARSPRSSRRATTRVGARADDRGGDQRPLRLDAGGGERKGRRARRRRSRGATSRGPMGPAAAPLLGRAMNRLTMDEHGACDLLSGRFTSTRSARRRARLAARGATSLSIGDPDVRARARPVKSSALPLSSVAPSALRPQRLAVHRAMLLPSDLALQSRLVQQLVAVRQREMDAILKRYARSAHRRAARRLRDHVAHGAHVRVRPDGGEPRHLTFFASSADRCLALVPARHHLHDVHMQLGAGASRCAGRRARSRARPAVRGEKNQINAFFTVGIISFAVQTVCAVWILDETPKWTYDSIAATAILGLAGVVIFWYHRRMHGRFFGDSAKLLDVDSDAAAAAAAAEEAATAPAPPSTAPSRSTLVASSAASAGPPPHRTRPRALVAADAPTAPRARATARRPSCTTLLDNPVALVDSHPDIANDDTAAAAASTSGDFAMRGLLYKRVAAASARRRLASAVTSEWRERFFVLSPAICSTAVGGGLRGGEGGRARQPDRPPRLRGALRHGGPAVGVCAPADRAKRRARVVAARADGGSARLEWARKLVVATLMRS